MCLLAESFLFFLHRIIIMPPKVPVGHGHRPVNLVNITGFQNRTAAQNRQQLSRFHLNPNTMIVRFRYGTVPVGRRPAASSGASVPRNGGRTGYVLLYRRSGTLFTSHDQRRRWVQLALRDVLINSFNRIGLNMSGTDNNEEEFQLEFDSDGEPVFTVDEIRTVMNDSELLNQLGQAGLPSSAAGVPMFGYNEEQEPQHRAFRYMIEGCDMRTLSGMVPQDWFHTDCNRMCTYNMLANINTPDTHRRPIKVFRPESVNRWLNENGYPVGGLTDGVSSDDIQAHAVQFQYGHCAMDLARSVLNLYIPFENKRNHHYKTACYVVVGDHCQPIVDQDVVHSIMKSVSQRMGRRNVIGYGATFSSSSNTTPNATVSNHNHSESIGLQQNQTRRKRRRSLDRVFRPEFERGEERQLQDQWKDNADISVDHWEDDFSDNGSLLSIPSSARGSDDVKDERGIRRRIQLPLVTETDRFHFFTRAEDLTLVEERCKPTYREGSDPSLIHYYICTDEDDVEFLYNYLIRVLLIDPLRYARSFNGRCRQIRMQNTWWCANRDIRSLMELHGIMQPKEPFRMGGMATYGFRMLQQELCRLTRKAGAIWECMSHYPPNLQRLLDTCHPFNRPKLLQCTYQAPYTNPRESPDRQTVRTLIPMSHRFRIDLIRSYASTIRNLKDDQYPIHDPTNVVVPYDEAVHHDLPIGHYLVQLPTAEEIANQKDIVDDWKKLPCLPLGESRMMSHRMLRALIHRNLLTKANIRLVCATDPFRQNKYGTVLVMALQNVLQEIHKNPKLQTICPKALINHLIGLCNGTSVPHSGMRYVFRDLQHLYTLLVNIVSEDQLSRLKVAHIHGYDPLWHKTFEYYEIDSSGLSHRSFHLQPIFNMVLEDQAMRIFDIAHTIPLKNLIQINVDAIEYHLEDPRQRPTWARDIADATIDEDAYKALTPAQMYDEGYMGRYKMEHPKDETRAMLYHYKFNQPNAHATLHKFFNGSLGLLEDTEHQDWIPQWKASMTPYSLEITNQKHREEEEEPDGDDVTTDGMMNQMLTDMFLAEDRSGLLVTGPAGTGKTHWIRLLQNYAVNLSNVVVKTAYTHAACVQMGSDAVTLHALFGMDEKSDMRYTLSMSPKFMAQMRQLEIDVLIVDEISMIPLILLEVLMVFHRVSPKTRICLFGDFHQLAPVEPQWDRPDTYNYFEKTDIFPYLVYDRVRNTHGRWVQLTECMRTNDPLLVSICKDPLSVQKITPIDFPMPPTGIPIWRFISWRNTTRKATNYFCGYRYLQMHPDTTRATLCLRDLYAKRKYTEYQRKQRTSSSSTDETDGGNAPTPSVLDMDYFRKQFATTYKPSHWIYLQNTFTYAVGMEVVCRNTLKQWDGGKGGENNNNTNNDSTNSNQTVCTNNRRGRIVDIDPATEVLTIRWVDVIRRYERRLQEQEEQDTHKTTSAVTTDESIDTNTWKNTPILGLEDEDVVLTYYDFAFNFVPGFCITAHMAQGETIKEHYGIMEWQEMVTMPRMAYVAVSRGSTSQYLHIVPPYANPWNITDTSSLEDNILHKLFINFRWDKNQVYDIQVDEIKQRILEKPTCAKCNVNLLLTRFNYKSKDQFCLTTAQPKTLSLSLDTCMVVCDNCFQSIVFPKKNAPVIVVDTPVVLDDEPPPLVAVP